MTRHFIVSSIEITTSIKDSMCIYCVIYQMIYTYYIYVILVVMVVIKRLADGTCFGTPSICQGQQHLQTLLEVFNVVCHLPRGTQGKAPRWSRR